MFVIHKSTKTDLCRFQMKSDSFILISNEFGDDTYNKENATFGGRIHLFNLKDNKVKLSI